MEQYEQLILKIKDNSLNSNEYFKLAQDISKCTFSDNKDDNLQAQNLLIYILNYWQNVPIVYKKIYTDLMANQGFYPYLEKEKDRLELDNTKEEIKKELHKAHFIKSDREIFFHKAQNELRSLLFETNQNIVVSAPTSFGKSLLIEEIVASAKYKNILIIQPTLALLNETRNNLRKYEDSYKIIIRVKDFPSDDKNNLFLLTAERVMEYKDLPQIDFFILDEFYKISQFRNDTRYDVLNNACNKLLNRHHARFYFLGPNIDSISEEFIKKYNVLFKKYNYSLVVNEEVEIKNGKKYYSDTNDLDIKEERLFDELVNLSEQTIIYCSSPEKASNIAIKFSNFLSNLNENYINDEKDIPLISWISSNLSSEWELNLCLRYGIGVHNGAFPKHINSATIDYFNNSKLKYLFCTSTIIEGVNTSTKNVIIYNNWRGKKHNKIDYFDYKNIKGRSGRMFKHYVGVLYNFYPTIKEEELNVDIPFVDQKKPLNKDILIQLDYKDIKDKNSREYLELSSLPADELELFRANGIDVVAQKQILDYIDSNFSQCYNFLSWNAFPSYNQLKFITKICFKYFLHRDIQDTISSEKLAVLINKCNRFKNLSYTIKDEINYRIQNYNSNYNEAAIRAFKIQRNWFDYIVPKWFNCINEIQKFLCKKHNQIAGDFSYFLQMLENDYMSSRANILMEYDLPRTAIKRLDDLIPKQIEEQDFINYIKTNTNNVLRQLSSYERERIRKEIL